MTFIEIGNLYLEKETKRKVKERTFNLYKYLLNKQIYNFLNSIDIKDINDEIIENYINNLTINSKLSENTIKIIASLIKQILTYAYNLKLISNKINKIYIKSSYNKSQNIFNKDDYNKLLNYCKNNLNKEICKAIYIVLNTGIRIGELLALTKDDISIDNNYISINKTLYYDNGIKISKPKTRSSNRIIPINNNLKDLLIKINTNIIIHTKDNNYVSPRSLQDSYKRLLKKLNITYLSFHKLRHSFATTCLSKGMDVKTLSEILGHSNTTITLNRYVHTLFEYKLEYLNKL